MTLKQARQVKIKDLKSETKDRVRDLIDYMDGNSRMWALVIYPKVVLFNCLNSIGCLFLVGDEYACLDMTSVWEAVCSMPCKLQVAGSNLPQATM